MRTARALVAAGVVGIGALSLPGCLANQCLLQYCDGPGCQCSVSTCGEGAAWDDSIRQCRCLPGRALVGGHCLNPEVATTYCGPGYRFENGGCVLTECRPGDEIDRSTGLCIPRDRVNQVASNMGVNVGAGQKLGCPPGQKLVIEGGDAACVPLAQSCAPDETFDGRACVKPTTSCPEGAAWDAAQRRCVAFARPAEGPAVDVAQWTFANFGPDGGNGAPAFCNAFARKPWSFGVNEGSTAILRAAVTLTFPEGQIGKGVVSTSATFAASGAQVPPRGANEVQAAARAVVAPLLQHGGKAAAPRVTTTVKCAVVSAARPQAVPATGGL